MCNEIQHQAGNVEPGASHMHSIHFATERGPLPLLIAYHFACGSKNLKMYLVWKAGYKKILYGARLEFEAKFKAHERQH